ncbi:hypothetical protein PESP_a0234 [Pseudoalteromonas espejiana DSM 9414]|nr:hypothetical protein PESP_a0234 [Pseudoalteromonas espejiana DSM 9414]
MLPQPFTNVIATYNCSFFVNFQLYLLIIMPIIDFSSLAAESIKIYFSQ